MKKLTSIALSALLATSMTAMAALAQEDAAVATAEEAPAVDTSNVVQLNVLPGLCTLADNPATNADASGYALCYAADYGTGRTTQGDAVTWEKVKFTKDVKQVAIKCGYGPMENNPNSSTEFHLYLNNIEGDPIAVVSVTNDATKENFTKSSRIDDQIYRVVDLETPIAAGEYTIIVVGETQYSGSFSQVNFMYEPMDVNDAGFKYIAETNLTDNQAKSAAAAEKKEKEEAEKADEPEATEPEATEPEATEPETTEPETTEPETTEPETKGDETKVDETKGDETKGDETKTEETKTEEKPAEAKKDNNILLIIIIVAVVAVVVIGGVVIAKKKK